MDTKYTSLRLTRQVSQRLKILAAIRGESMQALIERLVNAYESGVTFSIPAAPAQAPAGHETPGDKGTCNEEMLSLSA
jgi:hypothetical protein